MGRTTETSISWYACAVQDRKKELLKRKYGLKGIGFHAWLHDYIFSSDTNHFAVIDADNLETVLIDLDLSEDELIELCTTASKIKLIDKQKWEEERVLASPHIQTLYLNACAKRQYIFLDTLHNYQENLAEWLKVHKYHQIEPDESTSQITIRKLTKAEYHEQQQVLNTISDTEKPISDTEKLIPDTETPTRVRDNGSGIQQIERERERE